MTEVSVLLPTRGRQDSLRRSVTRLRELAASPDDVEVLVAVDHDDTDDVWRVTRELVESELVDELWRSPVRHGYSRLNEYFNRLAEMSHGRWLLLWNDDAEMMTDAWDVVLRDLADRDTVAAVADLRTQHSPHLCTFPAVARWAYRAVGTFSPTCHCDTWWQDIARRSRTIRDVDIHVVHRRADLTGEHNDLTRQEALAGYRSVEFYGPTVQGWLAEATRRVADAAVVRTAVRLAGQGA